MLSHSNLGAMAAMMAEHLKITGDDHCLLILPLFHVNAICISFLTPIAVGGQLMPYDPVWHPRIGRWAHAVEIDELIPFFQEARKRLEAELAAKAEARAARGFLGRLVDRLRGR